MLVNSKKLLQEAKLGRYAIPAPDFVDSNTARVFVKTAEDMDLPVILSYAEVHKDHLSVEEAADIGKFYGKRASVPVVLHLDHGMHFDVLEQAAKLGFTSLMVDASDLPLEENIRRTRDAAELARSCGATLEAEIGHVGTEGWGIPALASGSVYTDVEEAVRFVRETGVDSLAVSIGTTHGLYKGEPVLSFERLRELRQALELPLVLHGGSGSGDENLAECAREGVCKVNLFTDFITAALEKVYAKQPGSWLSLLRTGDDAMEAVLRRYYKVLGTKR